MIEIKIMFKNGECVYYTTDDNIELVFELIGDAIRDERKGVINLKEISNDKRTLVNIQEIATFGYSEVVK